MKRIDLLQYFYDYDIDLFGLDDFSTRILRESIPMYQCKSTTSHVYIYFMFTFARKLDIQYAKQQNYIL